MNAHATLAETPSADPDLDRPTTCARSLAEQLDAEIEAAGARHRAHLAEMAEIAMEMARLAHRRMVEQDAAIEAGDAAGAALRGDPLLGFNRVTRVVRLTMAMEARMLEARRRRLLGLEDERAAEAAAVDAARTAAEQARRDGRSGLLGLLVEDAVKQGIVQTRAADPSNARDVFYEEDKDGFDEDETELIDEAITAADRLLARGRAYAGFADRPVSAVLGQLCADLGVTPDWSEWAKDDWALDEAERGVAGSPYVVRETGPP